MAGYSDNPIKVIAVVGPTATGKTAVAVQLAKRVGGEVVCADSMQIYRHLDIGTAKPTPAEMDGVPHHMYGIIEPSERYSVARYAAEASETARGIAARGNVPILCGGTGLYISSFIHGVAFDKRDENPEARDGIYAEYEQKGAGALIEEIAAADPVFAGTLHPNNKKRIVRAVELLRSRGYTIPKQNELSRSEKNNFLVHLAIINCSSREIMYNRINTRVDAMLDSGLLNEARYVFDNKNEFKTAAQAIGYKEFFGFFEGEKDIGECTEKLKQATRNYAKRQLTWFRREKEAVWYNTADNVTSGKVAESIEKNL